MTKAMQPITADDLEALAVGAWILGTGGGGSPYTALLNLRRLYADGVRLQLMDPADLADDDMVAVVSSMGAPLVGQERLKDSRDAARAVEILQDYTGKPFRAVMSVEIGGGNAFQPLMAAAHLGLPVVDADAMGRAFPEAQMTSFAIGDLKPYPLSLYDPRGVETVVAKVPSWKWMEQVSRKVCVEVGSIAATCKAPRTGREVKDWGILHTTTKAIRLGHIVAAARRAHADPVTAILEAEDGKMLFRGKVADVARRATAGFLRGAAKFDGLDGDRGRRLELAFQNEWIVAWIEGQPAAMCPDLICVIDSVSGEAIGTETLRYGQRVSVIVLPAPPVLMTPRGLEFVGPRAFGYDLEFRSVFDGEAAA